MEQQYILEVLVGLLIVFVGIIWRITVTSFDEKLKDLEKKVDDGNLKNARFEERFKALDDRINVNTRNINK